MGCQYSKVKKRNQKRAKNDESDCDHEEDGPSDISAADIINKQDQETIKLIKKDLNETPETFVLNNVLLCTIFLKNYHEEIYQVSKDIGKAKDNFWDPDMIMEKVNQNIVYRPMHGPKKDIAEPLVTRRIYVPMHEYVEVTSPLDDEEGSEANSSSKYQVQTEESKRQGYVKLRRLDGGNNHDGSSTKSTLLIPLSSNTSGSSDTESTCTSTGMTVQENPQLIKDQTDEGTLDDCFVYRKVKKPDIDLEIEDMDYENLTDDDIYDIVSYLPSRNFMKYFQSKVFKNSTAERLGLVQYEIDHAVVDEHIPGKVFCNLRDENGNCYPVEVLPCLKMSWPNKQTYEFLEGTLRSAMIPSYHFQWPTEKMLSAMKHLECALVPKGYSRKRGEYPEGDLEWEIHFPLAERYLELFLRPEQIKCYLVLLTLYKEYLEPYTKRLGIIPEHFLTLIYWESEKNYDAWSEHRLGVRLISLIHNFSNRLSQRSLPNYFIRKKNILKNVSRRHLEHANEVFHRIKESPVMLIIRALRNIRYISGKFYPPLNYKELLDILYKKDWDDNPSLSHITLNYISSDNISVNTTTSEKKPKFIDAEMELQRKKVRDRRRKLANKKVKENNIKNVANLSYNVNLERRGSCDSVDDDWECEKRFDRQKKIALLKFFINNFLDIARTSQKIGSRKQTLFYLKQAWYLTKILEEENQLFAEEVAEFFKAIKEEEDRVINVMQTNLEISGSLEGLYDHNNNMDGAREVEESLNTLDDVFERKDGVSNEENTEATDQINVNADIHQQIRKTTINLRTLSKSFSTNLSQPESIDPI